jgi:hypothetical protein
LAIQKFQILGAFSDKSGFEIRSRNGSKGRTWMCPWEMTKPKRARHVIVPDLASYTELCDSRERERERPRPVKRPHIIWPRHGARRRPGGRRNDHSLRLSVARLVRLSRQIDPNYYRSLKRTRDVWLVTPRSCVHGFSRDVSHYKSLPFFFQSHNPFRCLLLLSTTTTTTRITRAPVRFSAA